MQSSFMDMREGGGEASRVFRFACKNNANRYVSTSVVQEAYMMVHVFITYLFEEILDQFVIS